MASTMATAAIYWMNTMGREAARWAGWLMTTEKRSEPGGATQTLDPRPRPAICVVAVKTKPVGSLLLSLGFLFTAMGQ